MKGQFPWIGRSRGSAGGMTTAKINDKNVMRAKAFEVTNPKTAAQVMQRDFFKQVQEVCASVTEDQLRSLYGNKPKAMTRRNLLAKQLFGIFIYVEGEIEINSQSLFAIGNGQKIHSPICLLNAGSAVFEESIYDILINAGANDNQNIIFVVYDTDKKKIVVINTTNTIDEFEDTYDFDLGYYGIQEGVCYLTYADKGVDAQSMQFGEFTIKTRYQE